MIHTSKEMSKTNRRYPESPQEGKMRQKQPPQECPSCGKNDIQVGLMTKPAPVGELGEETFDPRKVLVWMHCFSCGKSWKEYYVFESMLPPVPMKVK